MITPALSYLFQPPESNILPPVDTLVNELPFDKLYWRDFERLCLAIVEKDFSIDDCQIYGLTGQAQFGIDIYARKSSGKFSTYQCKQYESFKPLDLQKAVQKFSSGKWALGSDDFFLCTSCKLDDTKVLEKFELLKSYLLTKAINFIKWDATQLNRILKDHPIIVYRFFGSNWVELFNGKDALVNLSKEFQLDSATIQKYRNDLHKFYSTVFNTYDPGLFSQEIDTKSFLLQDRFIVPDVISSIQIDVAAILDNKAPESAQESRNDEINSQLPENDIKSDARYISSADIPGSRRMFQTLSSIDNVLPQYTRCVIFGEPGSGKSTLLRCIILDLLNPNAKLLNVVKSWGANLPVWIPFAFLTKNLSLNPNLSIQEILKLWFKSHNTEKLYDLIELALKDKRLILFVDGLDEWSNVSAAHQALTKIEILSDLLDTKIIYSSRPHGFKYLQDSIRKVEVLSLAPFTHKKQYEFITKWLSHWYTQQNKKGELHENLNEYIKHQSDSFHKEISSSQDLRTLAEYPLLLNILIFQKLRDSALSKSKINAFEEMISYLIDKHPVKRKVQANIIEEASFELSDYLRDIFSELALDVLLNNSDGIIPKSDAQKIFENYLLNTFGFDKNRSMTLSRQLLEIGANTIGIIIEKSPNEISFVHRQFLEFLAAKCLASSDKEKTDKILQSRCFDPIWHQTILSFFSLIPQGKKQEFLYNFSLLESGASDLFSAHYKKCLQYEISITLPNCPIDLSKRNYINLLGLFSFETNVVYKKGYLEILMDGISNPKLTTEVLDFSKSYLPNYTPFLSYSIPSLKAIKTENLSPEVIHFVMLSFLNGTTEVKFEASDIMRHHIQNSQFRDFISDVLNKEPDLILRAFALNSIASKDFPEERLASIIEEHKSIQNPYVQLFCIKGKILLNIHTDDDLDAIVSDDKYLGFRLQEVVLQMLLDGWEFSERLKAICLNAVKKNRQSRINFSQDTAWKILFHSFNKDKEVIDRVVEEIKTEKYPFNIIHEHNGWPYIANYFKLSPELAPVIDEWIDGKHIPESEIAYACLTSRSKAAKEKLLSLLPTTVFSHWIVMALIEGWGDDVEAIEVLKIYFRSDNKSKSYASYFLAKVFKDDKEERIKLMEEILFTESYYFRERVLTAFLELDKDYFKNNILHKFLTEEIYKFSLNEDFNPFQNSIHTIAQEFYDHELVEKLIFRNVKESFYYFDLIVKKEPPGSPRMIAMLQMSLPLSPDLRIVMLEKLVSKIPSSKEVLNLFLQFPDEGNKDVRMSMAIRLFRHLKFIDQKQLLSLSHQYVFYRGFDYEIQRQIAFSGYLILGKLDEYFQLKEQEYNSLANPAISFYESHDKLNVDFILLLIEEFEYIHREIKGDFQKISKESSEYDELPGPFLLGIQMPLLQVVFSLIIIFLTILTHLKALISLNS